MKNWSIFGRKGMGRKLVLLAMIWAVLMAVLTGCGRVQNTATNLANTENITTVSVVDSESITTAGLIDTKSIAEDGSYTSEEDVALYLHTYGRLPDNFMTKSEAKKLGWSGGSLEQYAKGKSIGGDRFGNYEGKLPKVKGRTYYECDIDTLGKNSRGAKRIIYSNDGWIYYTEDHYNTFTTLYEGEE